MANYTESIEKLLSKLIKLPGIGRRSAERIVNYILNAPKEEVRSLAEALFRARENVRLCKVCNNLSEQDVCAICQDKSRQRSIICVVEEPSDVNAIEKSGGFKGIYHVLLGSISPLEGRGPDDLKLESLANRIKQDSIQEVIIATDADNDGQITALYISKVIKPLGVKISRIGLGIPVGGNLEYADATTLSHALAARREI